MPSYDEWTVFFMCFVNKMQRGIDWRLRSGKTVHVTVQRLHREALRKGILLGSQHFLLRHSQALILVGISGTVLNVVKRNTNN